MPYKSGSLKIAGTKFDRRRKLTEKDKVKIKELHSQGWAIRAIARMYKKVCRRTIIFILYPERLAKERANRDWRDYYKKEKFREYMKKHRRYKQKLYLDKMVTIV